MASPEAVSLPIKLAVALLKDREGTIEPEAERKALRTRLLENRLKAKKLEAMIAAGG